MSSAIPIFEAKNKLPFFIHQVEKNGAIYLSRHNKNVAVLISAKEYDALLDQIHSQKKKKSFIELAQDFRNRNQDFYSDQEIEKIFSEAKNSETISSLAENEIFSEFSEDANDWNTLPSGFKYH